MPGYELIHKSVGRWLSYAVGNIDCEKIAGLQKSLDRVEANVVGIDKPQMRPLEGSDGPVSSLAHTRRLAANQDMLAVGFIPDWGDQNTF